MAHTTVSTARSKQTAQTQTESTASVVMLVDLFQIGRPHWL